jgi:hypothetical protein
MESNSIGKHSYFVLFRVAPRIVRKYGRRPSGSNGEISGAKNLVIVMGEDGKENYAAFFEVDVVRKGSSISLVWVRVLGCGRVKFQIGDTSVVF